MDQDALSNTEPQPDETNGDITRADVNPMPLSDGAKNEVKLEDLFVDVDSDDEFPSTGKATQSQTSPSSSAGPASPPDRE